MQMPKLNDSKYRVGTGENSYQDLEAYQRDLAQYTYEKNMAKDSARISEEQRKLDEAKAAAQEGYAPDALDSAGKPLKKAFLSPLDAKNWTLPENLKMQVNPITGMPIEGSNVYSTDISNTYDPTLQKYITEQATSLGPSAWAKVQLQNQALEQSQAFNQAAKQSQASQAAAMRNLASRGGASQGAMERLLMGAQQNTLGARQQVGLQGALARGQIGAQDVTAKQSLLTQAQGMEAARAQQAAAIAGQNAAANLQAQGMNQSNTLQARLANQSNAMQTQLANQQNAYNAQGANISNVLSQANLQNAYNANAYNQAMAAWAAKEQGTAQANAGSGGGK